MMILCEYVFLCFILYIALPSILLNMKYEIFEHTYAIVVLKDILQQEYKGNQISHPTSYKKKT